MAYERPGDMATWNEAPPNVNTRVSVDGKKGTITNVSYEVTYDDGGKEMVDSTSTKTLINLYSSPSFYGRNSRSINSRGGRKSRRSKKNRRSR